MKILDPLEATGLAWPGYESRPEIERLPLDPWEGGPSPDLRTSAIYVLRRVYLRPEDEVTATFQELANEWERDTLLIASPREAAMHPAYQRIIGLGLQAVPLLLERLDETKRQWFWALAAITHENPAQGLESVDEAALAWREWGYATGYLDVER